MTFVYPMLLGGLLLAGLPVLLHFLIRKKPITLLFPAFRFLLQKQRSNTRNLRLKHLLLLLLRIALIVLVCLALARPRLLHELIGISREKPVALVLIFDTSPSMEYKNSEMTRLELAKKRCLELLDQLPEDGRVLILDTSDPAGFAREDWLKSLEKARQRIQSLTIRPDSVPVTKALDEAQRRFDAWDRKTDDPVGVSLPRVVCVFSDRTKASWDSSATGKRDRKDDEAKVQILYFDVGIDEPVDLAITQAELPGNRQSFTDGETIRLSVGVKATGKKMENKLIVQIGNKKLEQPFPPIEADKQESVPIEIDTAKLELGPGLHQAEVRLESEKDLLSFNNVRYVTFEIQAKQRVLVLADDVKNAALFVHALESSLYSVDVRSVDKLDGVAFASYDAVFLDGVAAPSEKLWLSLTAFVQQGGGLGIVPPGNSMKMGAYNTEVARNVMPAPIIKKESVPLGIESVPLGIAWEVKADDLDKPFLRPFQSWFSGDVDISRNPRRADHYWIVEPKKADKDVDVIVCYSDERPAIVERVWPKSGGKVILLTTPMDQQSPPWNNYYENLHSFYPGLTLMCARHLCKEPANPKLNYQFGAEPPILKKNVALSFLKYLLTSGDASEEIAFENDRWVGARLPKAGNYVISGTNPGQKTEILHKFSINVPGEESDLTRVPIGDIEALLGKDALVPQHRDTPLLETLNWDEPMELFPWLMLGLLFFLALESLLANRFYKQEPPLAA